jgi:hypothetical protein
MITKSRTTTSHNPARRSPKFSSSASTCSENEPIIRATPTTVDMFRCPNCHAAVETITGAASMTIVRHTPGCPLLIAATMARWTLTAASLPVTPRPVAFANRVGRSRWRPAPSDPWSLGC